jgi:hypothetical protein
MARAGRPRESGPRQPCGKLRQGVEPPAPTVIKRWRDMMLASAKDTKHASQIGELGFRGEISPREEAAAYSMAEVVGAFDRLHGQKRSAASPAYEVGRGGIAGLDEERLAGANLDQLVDSQELVRDKFFGLQEVLKQFRREARGVLENLVLDDQAMPYGWLSEVRLMLDEVAQYFARQAKGAKRRRKHRKDNSALLSEGKVKRSEVPSIISAQGQQPNVDRQALTSLLRTVRPDLSADNLHEAWRFFLALRDREKLRPVN